MSAHDRRKISRTLHLRGVEQLVLTCPAEGRAGSYRDLQKHCRTAVSSGLAIFTARTSLTRLHPGSAATSRTARRISPVRGISEVADVSQAVAVENERVGRS